LKLPLKGEVTRREAIKHRVGDFNDHEAHLLMTKEITEAISKYLKGLKGLKA